MKNLIVLNFKKCAFKNTTLFNAVKNSSFVDFRKFKLKNLIEVSQIST